jgi:hypothetical protein
MSYKCLFATFESHDSFLLENFLNIFFTDKKGLCLAAYFLKSPISNAK